MIRRISNTALILSAFAIVTLNGCSGGSDADANRPTRISVSGSVSFKSAPVEGATVTFHPTAVPGTGAFGVTDADGKFVMGTFESSDGVVPGSYKVTITKLEAAASSQPGVDDPNYDPTKPEPEPKNELPEKYSKQHTTDLTVEVGNEPKSDVKFELEG
ncbi:MAG: carboxypeptidase regulatory-like domain-containing protein [Planctomycetaceae bacterium]|nr:carboxypeptidase regulatory-like domain-containing protein [Planctomycetaceae bacterium]